MLCLVAVVDGCYHMNNIVVIQNSYNYGLLLLHVITRVA